MATFKIKGGALSGSIAIPPSKSHTLRALVFALLARGRSTIRNYLDSPDTTAMIGALRAFGADVAVFADRLEIEGLDGKLGSAEDVICSANSGQVLRFIGAVSALSPAYTVITGDHSIRHSRRVEPLLDALRQLGAMAVSMRQDGYAPIIVRGKIAPGKATLAGEDSQPVSALLIALSFLEGTSYIEVMNPGEKPWIELTLHWMRRFGLNVDHRDYTSYTIHGKGAITGFDVIIPADWSTAAYPIVGALVTGSQLTISGVDTEDVQGDKKILDILRQMGADIGVDIEKKRVTIFSGKQLQGQRIDVNDCIDAVPILAILGCFSEGTTELVGAKIARTKESDRIHAICTELKKMGAQIDEKEDGLVVSQSSLHGAELLSYSDHRVALALSVAALGVATPSQIFDVECIKKSYSGFVADFQAVGAKIEVY